MKRVKYRAWYVIAGDGIVDCTCGTTFDAVDVHRDCVVECPGCKRKIKLDHKHDVDTWLDGTAIFVKEDKS